MEPRSRASPEQFLTLIDFMERHGDLSRPQAGSQGRLRGDRLWQQLASLLNSVGGGVEKTLNKWKKVWADWKTKTKKKYMLIRQHASGTGGGPSSRLTLTALEERVVAIMGPSASVGQAGIQELGFNAPSQLNEQPSTQSEGFDVEFVLDASPVNRPIPTPPPASTSPPLAATSTPPLEPQTRPPPRTHPRSTNRQPSATPRSTATTSRGRLELSARRNRGRTPFDRAASQFVAIEQRRLELEEVRERLLHERETERLRLESERIEASREHNQLLRQLSAIVERLLDRLPPNSLPSTDILQYTD